MPDNFVQLPLWLATSFAVMPCKERGSPRLSLQHVQLSCLPLFFCLFCPLLTLLVIASQVTLARNECLFFLHVLRSFNIGYSLRRRCFPFVVLQIVLSNSVVIGLCGCRLDICFVGVIAKICSADSKEPKWCNISCIMLNLHCLLFYRRPFLI